MDYNSNDGMVTYVWGPTQWHFLHTMSFNYPVSPSAQDKRNYKNYIMSLQYVLPCGKCRDNFKKNLKSHPLNTEALKNRHNFSKWVYDLHNNINVMLGKRVYLTYEEVRDRYEHFRARCNKSTGETGCTIMKGRGKVKPKIMLNIVPKGTKGDSLRVDPKCQKN